MSQLIQIRRRLKAIETTKKIAHAMQLIARATHNSLKKQENVLFDYSKQLVTLFNTIKAYTPLNSQIPNNQAIEQKHLVILIASQRGLCGGFNGLLMQQFNNYIESILHLKPAIVVVGAKAVELLNNTPRPQAIKAYEALEEKKIAFIAHDILNLIIKENYTNVTVISNESKSFFVQKPKATNLVPFDAGIVIEKKSDEQWLFPVDGTIVLTTAYNLAIEGLLQYLLFDSLLAEQSARFVSMDFATRNAKKMIADLTVQYNKLRQMKITQELIELSSSVEIQ